MKGKLLAAPVVDPISILDVGCGSGAWTADIGKVFPHAQIIGLGATRPTYPQSSHFEFVLGNLLLPLPFSHDSMDYVHQRCLSTVIPAVCWQSIVDEMARITRPGGWIEILEGGTYSNAGKATMQFVEWKQKTELQCGFDRAQIPYLDQMLQAAGLRNVQKQVISVSIGNWEKRTEVAMSKSNLANIAKVRPRIIASGVSDEKFNKVLTDMTMEWKECGTEYQFYITYGQKLVQKEFSLAGSHGASAYRQNKARG
jgi:ubiquinone/menaquinone biosynthesis C-methylase UbiE